MVYLRKKWGDHDKAYTTTLLWQPLDQCPIATLQVNLKAGYSQENLIVNHNSILLTIYITIHGPCYNYTSAVCPTLMSMPYPYVYY